MAACLPLLPYCCLHPLDSADRDSFHAEDAPEDGAEAILTKLAIPENAPANTGGTSEPAKLKNEKSIGMALKKQPTLKQAGSLVQAETRAKGQVKTSYYVRYFAAWGALMLLPITVLLMTGLEKGIQQVQNWWLSVRCIRCMDFPSCMLVPVSPVR